MKTTRELQEIVGVANNSVGYNQSRSILQNLDKSVVAYAVGYGGFIVILVNKANHLMAYDYSAIHPDGKYPTGSFNRIDVEKALQIIKKNKLFVERKIDEKALTEAKQRKVFTRPHLGTYILDEKTSNTRYTYIIERFKNGKYCIKRTQNWRRHTHPDGGWSSRLTSKEFLQEYNLLLNQNKNCELICEATNKDLLKDIELFAALEEV